MQFSPDQVRGLRYADEARAFIAEVGDDPIGVVRHPELYSPEVVERAQFLDAWDVWLFSEEAEA